MDGQLGCLGYEQVPQFHMKCHEVVSSFNILADLYCRLVHYQAKALCNFNSCEILFFLFAPDAFFFQGKFFVLKSSFLLMNFQLRNHLMSQMDCQIFNELLFITYLGFFSILFESVFCLPFFIRLFLLQMTNLIIFERVSFIIYFSCFYHNFLVLFLIFFYLFFLHNLHSILLHNLLLQRFQLFSFLVLLSMMMKLVNEPFLCHQLQQLVLEVKLSLVIHLHFSRLIPDFQHFLLLQHFLYR